jgi:hypothetical protein
MTMQATAFCVTCGAPDHARGRFCGSCGAELARADANPLPAPDGESPAEEGASTTFAQQRPVVDNAFAWTLAVTPLLLILVDGAMAAAGVATGVTVGILIAVAVNTVLSVADSRRLKAVGINVPGVLAVLLVPVYLFVRQSRTKQAAWIPIVWCICFVASLANGQIIGRTIGVPIDASTVEQSISSGVQAQTGLAATATCPSAVVRVGSSFSCLVDTGTTGTITATVTVQNASGTVVWRLDNASSDKAQGSKGPSRSDVALSLKDATIAEMSYAIDSNEFTASLDDLASHGFKAQPGVAVAVVDANRADYCLAAGPVGGAATLWLSSIDDQITTTPCGD